MVITTTADRSTTSTTTTSLADRISSLTPFSTGTLRIAFVLTWATRTHVAPTLASLRWLVQNHDSPVEVTFVCSSYTKTFASDFEFVRLMDCGFDRNTDRYDAILAKALSTTDKFDNLKAHMELSTAIADDYELCARNYLTIFERERFDLLICDFFDRAAMDAAIESDTKMAISTMLGALGIGLAWYVPLLFVPMHRDKWMASPFKRVRGLSRMIPFVLHVRRLDKHLQHLHRKALGFSKPFQPFEQIFRTHLLVSHHMFGLDPARSVPSNMVVFGPVLDEVHVPPLEPEMQTQLDRFAADGMHVVLMAFGSLVAFQRSPALVAKLLKAVEALLVANPRIVIIWASRSHDKDQLATLPCDLQKRLLTPAWINQRRVLMHSATKVFISHGGMGSMTESIVAGKPMLVLPFFGDQFANAMSGEDANISLQISKDTFTPHEVVSKVDQLLTMDQSSLKRLQQVARLNSKTSPVVVSSALLCAATAGVDHLLPADVHVPWHHRVLGRWRSRSSH